MAMESMQGKTISSRFDLAYTDLFRIAAGNSGWLFICDSVLGDSLEFH